ncbi:hypothetical protein [Muricoccus pecuniae]|uniref:Uncharacterized protein n=1 Tax=Muricoccus pecuniae TaxID=693023 RepID=A0A840YLF7_9PROT|nr:hypothetical protein [Roseomonas pecuniae]MBB5695523.1 hypothetical protein [Roseomonas pecuniae]
MFDGIPGLQKRQPPPKLPEAPDPAFLYRGAILFGLAEGGVIRIYMPGTALHGWKVVGSRALVCRLIDCHLDYPMSERPILEEVHVPITKRVGVVERLRLDRLFKRLTGKMTVDERMHIGRQIAPS